jgi:hypothetical protein
MPSCSPNCNWRAISKIGSSANISGQNEEWRPSEEERLDKDEAPTLSATHEGKLWGILPTWMKR